MQQDFAPIGFAARSAQKSALDEPVGKFHSAVMLDLQALGEDSNRCLRACRQPFEGQQRLMLVRLHSARARRPLAEIEVAADFVAEIGQHSVIEFAFCSLCHDILIISYYDMK